MDKKYYTPTPEELHIGFEFEFEFFYKEGGWQSEILGEGERGFNNVDHIQFTLRNVNWGDYIRTRLVDREIIENLGWQFVISEEVTMSFTIPPSEVSNPLPVLLTIPKIIHNSVPISIGKVSKEELLMYSDTIFEGTIKSKSDLKRIMEYLGIKNA